MGKLFSINWKLFPPKAHYFLYFGGIASFWPYITVFAKQLGVTEMPVGLLFTVAPITGLLSMPFFGAIADKFKMKRKLFLFFNIVSLIGLMGFAFLPSATPERNVSLECGSEMTYIVQNKVMDQTNGKTKCNNVSEVHQHLGLLDRCQLTCKVNVEKHQKFCESIRKDEGVISDLCRDSRTELSLEVDLITSSSLTKAEGLFIPIKEGLLGCSNDVGIQDCEILCPSNQALDFLLQSVPEHDDVYTSLIFWAYVFLVLVNWVALAVVSSVADALCFQTLGDQPHLYGVQRQWGAVGWGLFSILAGSLVDFFSQGSLIKDYRPCFCLVLITMGVNLIVCFKWNVKEEERPRSLGKSVCQLLFQPQITVFVMACIIVGICTGLLWQFLFWYAEDIASCEHMEYIKVIQGLINVVQCFGGELPFFYVSSWFIKTLGHIHCMTLVLFAFGIRFIIYSFLSNPWHILPVELLQGVTYGIFYSNMASYAYVVSPPGSAATLQGIVGAAFEGVGVGIGSLVGGILYNDISGQLTFRSFGLFTLCFCVMHFLSMKIIHKKFIPVAQDDTKLEDLKNGLDRPVVPKGY